MGYITGWCVGVATSGNAIVMSYCCDSDLPKLGRLVDALVVCESMLIFSFKIPVHTLLIFNLQFVLKLKN